MSTDWHRLFGLLLEDFFLGSPFEVEQEKDLSLRKQRLDIVILRKRPGKFAGRLPDGLEDLASHNLLTFKSHREPLDDWALKELTGHYVNYRKQLSPPDAPLFSEESFRLYAVCARYPHNLANVVTLEALRPGVYRCRRGSDEIRIIVVRQLPEEKHNAPLHLFSAVPSLVQFGQERYSRRSDDISGILEDLLGRYRKEGINVGYTLEDFRRDYLKEHLKELPPEERLKDLSLEERLKGIPSEQLEQYLDKLRRDARSRQSRKGAAGERKKRKR